MMEEGLLGRIKYQKTTGSTLLSIGPELEGHIKMSRKKSTQKKSSAPTGTDGAETDHGSQGHARITGGRWDRGKLLQKDTGRPCPIVLKREDERATWPQIAEWISSEEGCSIPHQTVQRAFNSTLNRLKKKFLEDPFIKGWLRDNHFDIPEDEEEEGDSCTP